MNYALFAPVCSIASTRRRRFLWAAWWTGEPARTPFRKPDAFEGGARTREQARQAAQRAAGCPLHEVDGSWAKAWANVLLGQDAWAGMRRTKSAHPRKIVPKKPTPPSVWQILGVGEHATVLEIKAAYRKRALAVHPDRGGSGPAFRALQTAYESAMSRRERSAARPKRG